MGELLRRKLEALGYGSHDALVLDESLVSRLVSDLIRASQAGDNLRQKASDTALQLELANDKVASQQHVSQTVSACMSPSEHACKRVHAMHAELLCTPWSTHPVSKSGRSRCWSGRRGG